MSTSTPEHPSAQKVDAALQRLGLIDRVRELPDSTRTAKDAAEALGCEVGQIVKSIVFRSTRTSRPVLVLASGDHRVDEGWMERYVGEPIERADPEFARGATGFAIGGVPPFAHKNSLRTFVDYDLLERSAVWAAAGTPNAVFRLTPLELLDASDGRPVPVVPWARPPEPGGRWVTFDCYGTLVDWRTGMLRALDRRLPGLETGARERLFRTYLVEERRVERGPFLGYRATMIAALLAAGAVERVPVTPEIAERVVDSIPEWPLFPDTREALRALADRGVRLAVLSNIDRDLLERTLACHSLEVTVTITADEVHSYKPAPAHWVRFLKAVRGEPELIWHVAGAFEYDIPTAERLGFRTAFVTRYDDANAGEGAGVVVRNLTEFAERLALPPDASGSLSPPSI